MQTIKAEDIQKADYIPAVTLFLNAQDLTALTGLTFTDGEEDGLGVTKDLYCRADNGRDFIVRQYLQAPNPYNQQLEIECSADSLEADLKEALRSLKINFEQIAWVHPDIGSLYEIPSPGVAPVLKP
jgi:hypothetical protein